MSTDRGHQLVAKSVFSPNVPSPFPSSTETRLVSAFATARSGRPSPFRSAQVTAHGDDPTSGERKGAANRGSALAGKPIPVAPRRENAASAFATRGPL